MNTAIIHTDASTPQNPGPMRIGYAITAQPNGRVIARVGQHVGNGSVNIAEYLAIIAAMRHAFRLGIEAVHLFSDSQLVVNQITGKYRVKDKKLARLYREVVDLRKCFERTKIEWIGREANAVADKLSRETVYEEPHIPRPSKGGGRYAALMLPWQAALARVRLQKNATEYAVARAFNVPATSIRNIRMGRGYKDATLDGLPRWGEEFIFDSNVSVDPFPAPKVFTTNIEANDDEDTRNTNT